MNPEEIDRITALETEIRDLRIAQESIVVLLKQYGDQIGPAIEQLQNSTVGRMLFR